MSIKNIFCGTYIPQLDMIVSFAGLHSSFYIWGRNRKSREQQRIDQRRSGRKKLNRYCDRPVIWYIRLVGTDTRNAPPSHRFPLKIDRTPLPSPFKDWSYKGDRLMTRAVVNIQSFHISEEPLRSPFDYLSISDVQFNCVGIAPDSIPPNRKKGTIVIIVLVRILIFIVDWNLIISDFRNFCLWFSTNRY